MEWANLSWERPWAWWALLVPLAVLLVARRPTRPYTVATGALGLWRRVQDSPQSAEGARPQVPPGLWWLVLGLLSGIVAMAGPRSEGLAPSRVWRLIVDRSPSNYLGAASGGGTRLDQGLELLESEWRGLVRPEDSVLWFDGSEWFEGSSITEEWRSPPRAPMPAPEWERWDQPGSVWLCVIAPSEERSEASLCASGATPVPGLVAIDGEDRLDWGTGGLTRVVGGAPLRSVRLVNLQGDFPKFVSLWAEERGLHLNEGEPADEDVLTITRVADGASTGGEAWSSGPGWLELWADDAPRSAGGPAQFALTWSARLDELCLPAGGLSPVGARSLSGESRWALGRAPSDPLDGGGGQAWESWLALLSCGLVAVALVGFPR